jgi:hypothetical protein
LEVETLLRPLTHDANLLPSAFRIVIHQADVHLLGAQADERAVTRPPAKDPTLLDRFFPGDMIKAAR